MLAADRRAALLFSGDADELVALGVGAAPLPRRRITVPQPGGATGLRRPRGCGTIVVTRQALDDPGTVDLLADLALAGIRVLRPHEYYERALRRAMLDDLDESWFLFDRSMRRRRAYALVKRAMDLAAGLLGSLAVLLLVPVVWLLMRLEDGGQVFYRQERTGRARRPFMIWKFRTMRVDAEAGGPVWAAANDDRVTRLGRLLRRTRLDELPQFFNVLQGEMSLIGPRPERPRFVRLLERTVPFYDRRHMMRPGITGWATVRFGYGASVTDKWRSHEYDLYYLKHRSLKLDLEILARTVVVMLLRKGR
jgi:exopolysaccharide biosynthesis polyprenyl glycosylphosphotransferase